MEKVLCLVAHYYNSKGVFRGKSTTQEASTRKNITLRVLQTLSRITNLDFLVAGFPGNSLVNVDLDLSYVNDPRYIVYEALSLLDRYTNEYEYVMVLEDDILINPEIIQNCVIFDSMRSFDEILLPNRVEISGSHIYCVDLLNNPRRTSIQSKFLGRSLRIYQSPHSGIGLFRSDKYKYARSKICSSSRDLIVGGYMASAFAHYHKPFSLFRIDDGLDMHTVVHLDRYQVKSKGPFIRRFINKIF